MKKIHTPLAREGYPFILFCCSITLIFVFLQYHLAAIAGLLITGFIISFFRDPERIGSDRADAVVSPADGKVILIKEVFDDRFTGNQALKISIFMNIFNVHVNRIPYGGTVEKIKFKPGSFYSADSERAALHNEYCGVTIMTPDQQLYAVVQIAGLIARRIVYKTEIGDAVRTGERYGMICFGSRVDLYLPPQINLEISRGKKVKAGESILGYLN